MSVSKLANNTSNITVIKWIKIFIALVLFLIMLYSKPPAGIGREGYTAISVMVLMLALWILKPIHFCLTGLIGLILMSILQVGDFTDLVTGFSSETIFFLTAILTFSHAVKITGLDKSIAMFLVALSRKKLSKFIAFMPFLMLGMTALIPAAIARATIIKPILTDIGNTMPPSKDKTNFNKATTLTIGPMNPMLSMVFLSGGPAPFAAAAIITQFTNVEISWKTWFLMIGIPLIFLVIMFSIYIHFMYPVSNIKEIEIKTEKTGLANNEKILLLIAGLMVIFWFLGDYLSIRAVYPAFIGTFILFLPGVDILEIKSLRAINWELIIFAGLAISMAQILAMTGASEWLSNAVFLIISPLELGATGNLIFIAVILLFLRLFFFNNVPYLTFTLPVVLSLAPMLGINPILLAFIAVFSSGIIFIPTQSIAAIIAAEDDNHRKDIVMFGFILVFFCFIVLALSKRFLWIYFI